MCRGSFSPIPKPNAPTSKSLPNRALSLFAVADPPVLLELNPRHLHVERPHRERLRPKVLCADRADLVEGRHVDVIPREVREQLGERALIGVGRVAVAGPHLNVNHVGRVDVAGGVLFRVGGVVVLNDVQTCVLKARLALAMVVWQDPNLLVLDEPTNHLDLDMRHALEVALQGYEGALVLVSHDRHLLRNSVEQLVLVDQGRVAPYDGDLEAYERWILSAESTVSDQSGSESRAGVSSKERRKVAAEARAKLRPLQKALEKTERDIESLQAELERIQQTLADPGLYDDDRKTELAERVRDEGELKANLAAAEELWLQQQEELESLEAAV